MHVFCPTAFRDNGIDAGSLKAAESRIKAADRLHTGGMQTLQALRDELSKLDRVVVAFSGGVDSALLAFVAADTLGAGNAVAVTAVSPSLAGAEHNDCKELATRWGLEWREVHTDEMENAAYRINDGNRCFHCKDALMDAVQPIADELGATVILGVNLDDLGDHRPGQHAAEQRGAKFPMVDAGLDKAAVRQASRELGLETAEKPAAACLASRIPYGTPVSIERLTSVEGAELALKQMGFAEVRVRHYEESARIEVPLDSLARIVERRDDVVTAVRQAGYSYVTLDLEGLRSGNLNQALQD